MLLWTEVVCENCSQTTAGEFAKWGKRLRRELKETLDSEKWVVDQEGNAYCPSCIEEMKVKP